VNNARLARRSGVQTIPSTGKYRPTFAARTGMDFGQGGATVVVAADDKVDR